METAPTQSQNHQEEPARFVLIFGVILRPKAEGSGAHTRYRVNPQNAVHVLLFAAVFLAARHHSNPAGYKVMAPLAEAALQKALKP